MTDTTTTTTTTETRYPLETPQDGLRRAAATFAIHPGLDYTGQEVAFLLNTMAATVDAIREGDYDSASATSQAALADYMTKEEGR